MSKISNSTRDGKLIRVEIILDKYISDSIRGVGNKKGLGKLVGHIYCLPKRRLIDQINGFPSGIKSDYIAFLPLEEAKMGTNNGSAIFINKKSIVFISEIFENESKGLGLKDGQVNYPFVKKPIIRVKIEVPFYTITGDLHCASSQRFIDLLDEGKRFLAVTKAEIFSTSSNKKQEISFLALNKEQIVFLEEV